MNSQLPDQRRIALISSRVSKAFCGTCSAGLLMKVSYESLTAPTNSASEVATSASHLAGSCDWANSVCQIP
jgi:hypothetical protein